MLARALESDWAVEHDDKPEGEEESEDDILPGRSIPAECHAELHTDYDGAAVRWELAFHRENAADCSQACLDQAKHAKPGEKKCEHMGLLSV
ncbi:hypothetical protein TorRG33x02_222240 [Trema orientale]|uniref:Uncharacterized protein n=1 Tax=Trema orientale TaxID=63057 RepID=A0A2P5E904_TREOI|nr:hypothetical protein TorRG33x02_222240 [Trema orientale]